MVKTFLELLCNIYLYKSVDENFLEINALKECNVSDSELPLFMANFSAISKRIFHLMIETVFGRIITILNAVANAAKLVVEPS